MTDHLTKLLDRHAEQAELMRAVGLPRPKFHQDTADAIAALIEARATFQDIADTWESGMEWPGGDEEEAASYAGKARAALARIDALGEPTE